MEKKNKEEEKKKKKRVEELLFAEKDQPLRTLVIRLKLKI